MVEVDPFAPTSRTEKERMVPEAEALPELSTLNRPKRLLVEVATYKAVWDKAEVLEPSVTNSGFVIVPPLKAEAPVSSSPQVNAPVVTSYATV